MLKTLSAAVRLTAIAATAAAALATSPAAYAASESLPRPHHLSVGETSSERAAVTLAARRYAAFWNTGDESYAKQALAPDFIDRTLPDGRPQGPNGPLQASKGFRTAVPDLTAEIGDMVVAGDRASVHLHFHGHFTGQFQNIKGDGQTVDFQAFDLYRVRDGRIVENWHLEDNLTLLKQLGVVKP
ncbi:putative ester cyclase [Paraburkholderia sp. GAS448]|uniref:ester cyclase n=1 Tax=Paraburkholderia sp. GAS448 TaxID=3035136 RepID=UPI003D1C8AED